MRSVMTPLRDICATPMLAAAEQGGLASVPSAAYAPLTTAAHTVATIAKVRYNIGDGSHQVVRRRCGVFSTANAPC